MNVWQKIWKFLKDCWGWIVIALFSLWAIVRILINRARDNREISEHYRERNDSIEESTDRIESTVGDIEASVEDIGESEREATARIESAQNGIRKSEDHADNILNAVERIRELLNEEEQN